MALNFESWPADGIHPSQRPLFVTGKREDGHFVSVFVNEGDTAQKLVNLILDGRAAGLRGEVSFKTGSYVVLLLPGHTPIKAKVVAKIDDSQIALDLTGSPQLITSTVGGVVNFRQDYYVEVRYFGKDGNLVMPQPQRFYAGPTGDVRIDISAPSSLITPSLDGRGESLSIAYRAEFRESYDENRDREWAPFPGPLMLEMAHGSDAQITTGFTDSHIPKRFVDGYPLIYSYIVDPQHILFHRGFDIVYTELTLQQTNPYPAPDANKKTGLSVVFDETGQRVFVFEISGIHKDTVFIKFSVEVFF